MVYGGLWWFMVVSVGLWWFMVVYGGLWWFMVVFGGLWWFMVVHGGLWWFFGGFLVVWLEVVKTAFCDFVFLLVFVTTPML